MPKKKPEAPHRNTTTIWTDNERTRLLIWDAYEGFIEHYENYWMYLQRNTVNPVIRLGLIRYANRMWEEIRLLSIYFMGDKMLKEEDLQRMNKLFNDKELKFKQQDFHFMRRFFADFLFYSGIKNILMQKDMSSNYDKIKEVFGA